LANDTVTLTTGSDERAALESLLAKSAGTDIPVLLQAKEVAKRLVKSDPSSANLSALQRATTMLENAMSNSEGSEIFKSVGEVLNYLQESGRQIEKSKLYEDIRQGKIKKTDKKFKKRDVDRYAAGLPLSTTPDGRVKDAEDRQRRKDEAEIRIKESTAKREEIKTAVMEGKYVLREQVDQELAARAMALHSGLKSQFEAVALDLVTKVGGEPQKSRALVAALEDILDGACNEFARSIEFEVMIGEDEDEPDSDGTGAD
jgi:hypothetical protein